MAQQVPSLTPGGRSVYLYREQAAARYTYLLSTIMAEPLNLFHTGDSFATCLLSTFEVRIHSLPERRKARNAFVESRLGRFVGSGSSPDT